MLCFPYCGILVFANKSLRSDRSYRMYSILLYVFVFFPLFLPGSHAVLPHVLLKILFCLCDIFAFANNSLRSGLSYRICSILPYLFVFVVPLPRAHAVLPSLSTLRRSSSINRLFNLGNVERCSWLSTATTKFS